MHVRSLDTMLTLLALVVGTVLILTAYSAFHNFNSDAELDRWQFSPETPR